ncbi:MAG: cysteine--tRNA ligase, partial [Polyangiaceae bacterium]
MLRLYNTRTRNVDEFAPLREGKVRIYVCGLTPSAEPHLSHARSFLFFDVFRRYLTHLGYDVTYVQNVTDIDDRSIARARETGENWHDIVQTYYDSFKLSMRRLGVREPDVEPYATAFIEPILAMIGSLMEKG